MSLLAVQGGATGTGTVTILAPSTNTNQTLTLPDATDTVAGIAATQTLTNKSIVATQLTGTVAAARLPAGSVLQVVSTTKTDTFSTTSGSYVDVTGLSVSITPTSATSKIYAMVTLGFCCAAGARAAFQLVRSSTAIGIGDASGSRTTASASGGPPSPATMESTSFSFLDSPSTTSATTYKVQIAFIDASGTLYVNRTVNDDDAASRPRTASTITLMEIAA